MSPGVVAPGEAAPGEGGVGLRGLPQDSTSEGSTVQQAQEQWTPETVISTLASRPVPGSSSPLPFFHVLERLKTTKREGWRRFGLQHGESVADHMYRMAIITMLCPPALAARLDIARCTRLALAHDMAESLVGDITPVDGVAKPEKSRREAATMDYLCGTLLGRVHDGDAGAELQAAWREYEDDATPEAHFVHDVDKIELLLQMVEYERAHAGALDLAEFAHVAARIKLPEVRVWAAEVMDERRVFWESVQRGGSGAASANGNPTVANEQRRRQQDEYYGGTPGADRTA